MIWAEKYKLSFRLVPLALLIALSIVWTRKTPVPTKNTPLSPETSTVSDNYLNKADLENASELPKFNYTLLLGNGHKLSVNVSVSSMEEPKEGAYWCGAPFLLDYHGGAKAGILDDYGKLEDEITLTAPSLVVGKPPDYDYYYYKTYDLDGDNNSYEFIILDYSSCNGNWAKIVKADPETHKFLTLTFQIDGEEKEKILTGPNKDDLVFSQGRLSTKTYDAVRGLFYKREFIYKNGKFVQTSGL